ncbi:MAG: alpha/beta hydrolase [Verrucomicrobiales bacterium]
MRTFLASLAFAALAFVAAPAIAIAGEPNVFPLWPQGAPDANGLTGPEKPGGCIGNISEATLTVFPADPEKATGAAVVLTPGGGYGVECYESEGVDPAKWLAAHGICGIVLKYRLPNGHHHIPGADAARAIRTARERAKEWGFSPDKVGIWGFSAGGHLAATASTLHEPGKPDAEDPVERHSSRPDFSILSYPVISMEEGVTHGGSRANLLGKEPAAGLLDRYSLEKQVSEKNPTTFLMLAADDRVVLPENSIRFFQALLAKGVDAEMHIYKKGGHGPNMKQNDTWEPVLLGWLKRAGLTK